MRYFKHCACSIIALMLFTACATDPTYSQFAESIPPIPEDQGRIYFYRASHKPDSIRPQVRVNDVVVGRAVPNGFFYVDRMPGSYDLTTKSDAGRSMSINVRRAGVIYIRVDVKLTPTSWDMLLAAVPEAVARQEMQETHYQL